MKADVPFSGFEQMIEAAADFALLEVHSILPNLHSAWAANRQLQATLAGLTTKKTAAAGRPVKTVKRTPPFQSLTHAPSAKWAGPSPATPP